MDEYIKVENDQFQLMRIGDFIRWYSEGELTTGAMIIRFGRTKKGRYNWTLRFSNKSTYTLYWDICPIIYVKKNVYYEILEQKILSINANIQFLVQELGLTSEFEEHKKKVYKQFDIQNKKKHQMVLKKRRHSFN